MVEDEEVFHGKDNTVHAQKWVNGSEAIWVSGVVED